MSYLHPGTDDEFRPSEDKFDYESSRNDKSNRNIKRISSPFEDDFTGRRYEALDIAVNKTALDYFLKEKNSYERTYLLSTQKQAITINATLQELRKVIRMLFVCFLFVFFCCFFFVFTNGRDRVCSITHGPYLK